MAAGLSDGIFQHMVEADDSARAEALLRFWFGAPGSPERDQPSQERAAAGGYSGWLAGPDTALALILLLDQLSRNLFRGSARAFASDDQAWSAARDAVARGFDGLMPPVRRWFVYLPFEHSESLADQELSVQLFGALPASPETERVLDYARRHRDIIARFGRFPHRNRVLGRASTGEEDAFLHSPGSAF